MVCSTLLLLAALLAADEPKTEKARKEAGELVAQLAELKVGGLWFVHDEKAQDAESVAARALMKRLTRIGKPAVPELIAVLDSKNQALVDRAALVLAQVGPDAVDAIPALVQQLKYEQGYVPERMTKRALRQLGPIAAPELLKASGDKDARIRAQAAMLLAEIRPVSKETLDALVKLLADENDSVKLTAAHVLEFIGEPAVAILIDAMEHDTENKLFNPSGILMGMGPVACQAVPVLREKLKAPYPVVEHATYALLAIEVERASREARSEDINTRLRASWVLGKGYWRNGCTKREGEAAIEALVDALRDEDARVRENATKGLAHTGPWAKSSLPALVGRLEDASESLDVRQEAVVSLGTLRAAGRDALPALRQAARQTEEQIRHSARRAIERIENPDADLGCDE